MSPGQQLAVLLERELECMRQLRDILEREHQALVAADVFSLEDVTREKNHILGCQAEAAQLRQEYLDRCGIGAGNDALEDYFASCDNRGQLLENQGELRVLARHCHDANRSNGRIIAQRQQHTLGALSILRQSDASSPTYSGGGDTQDSQSSRLLGKA